MDPRGNIYEDDPENIPPEDKARLDGFLKGRAEADEKTELQRQVAERERVIAGLIANPDPTAVSVPGLSPTLGIKLASIAAHAREMVSTYGHHFDLVALEAGLADPEVVEYMAELDALALLPKARRADA